MLSVQPEFVEGTLSWKYKPDEPLDRLGSVPVALAVMPVVVTLLNDKPVGISTEAYAEAFGPLVLRV